jgi:aminobenzoyl-glutamate utilization protein A
MINEEIQKISESIEQKTIEYRRDFHKYAESGWMEFRTASLVARKLTDLGYMIKIGPEVIDEDARMGLPSPEDLEKHWQRAKDQGGDGEYLDPLRGGFTGIVGILKNGSGPTIGLRFDMDALDVPESQHESHRPFRNGFSSVNPNVMHACGHDCHTAVGLAVAEILMELEDEISGTVKLIFQPAEEGVRGAKSMVAAGVVDDVDFLLGHHVYSGWRVGEIIPGLKGYTATQKFNATFTGAASHAGGSPQDGKNALQAAATAVLNLYGIPRHSGGATRINVGKLTAGSGRNVICPSAHLDIETRGADNELSEYMYSKAIQVLEASAKMYDCKLEIRAMGSAPSAISDQQLAERIEQVARQIGEFSFSSPNKGGGSEDFSYMMNRVKENGGLAANIGVGASLKIEDTKSNMGQEDALKHHTPEFDIDERAMKIAMELMTSVAFDIMKQPLELPRD